VGFPRSGTTLLEQVLASHPQIETLEEVFTLTDSVRNFIVKPGGLDTLASLADHELVHWRSEYWRRVAESGRPPARKVFVDKMPLNYVYLGLIARLFPKAKVLFALRDPREVLLGCIRRRFVMTAHMYELTTLDGIAAYYDVTMRLMEIYRSKLDLEILDVRNDRLVADFEGETRRLCAFLGIDWDETVRGFAQIAQARDIKTPSATQVRKGLATENRVQWIRYRNELAAALATMLPWVERFGYAAPE
jgi:hypothetical protein